MADRSAATGDPRAWSDDDVLAFVLEVLPPKVHDAARELGLTGEELLEFEKGDLEVSCAVVPLSSSEILLLLRNCCDSHSGCHLIRTTTISRGFQSLDQLYRLDLT